MKPKKCTIITLLAASAITGNISPGLHSPLEDLVLVHADKALQENKEFAASDFLKKNTYDVLIEIGFRIPPLGTISMDIKENGKSKYEIKLVTSIKEKTYQKLMGFKSASVYAVGIKKDGMFHTKTSLEEKIRLDDTRISYSYEYHLLNNSIIRTERAYQKNINAPSRESITILSNIPKDTNNALVALASLFSEYHEGKLGKIRKGGVLGQDDKPHPFEVSYVQNKILVKDTGIISEEATLIFYLKSHRGRKVIDSRKIGFIYMGIKGYLKVR